LPSADDPQIFIASAGKSEHRILAVAITQTLSETRLLQKELLEINKPDKNDIISSGFLVFKRGLLGHPIIIFI